MNSKCECHKDFGGEDCSIPCANDNYVSAGACLNNQTCPAGTNIIPGSKTCKGCEPSEVTYNGNCLASCPSKTY